MHEKLVEIFVKRRDGQGFEAIATLAFKVTHGDGFDWDRICELGLSIEPGNALYQPGGQPNNPDGTPSLPAPLATQAIAPQSSGSVDLDMDLNFSLDEEPTSVITKTSASNPESAPSVIAMDVGLVTEAIEPFETPQPAVMTDAVEFGATNPAPPLDISEPKALPAPDFGMLEFDFGSLSLDLGDEPKADTTASPSAHEDPLATKLALAQEFSTLGDNDGARELIEEVIAEASGNMKIKAQRALSNL